MFQVSFLPQSLASTNIMVSHHNLASAFVSFVLVCVGTKASRHHLKDLAEAQQARLSTQMQHPTPLDTMSSKQSQRDPWLGPPTKLWFAQ